MVVLQQWRTPLEPEQGMLGIYVIRFIRNWYLTVIPLVIMVALSAFMAYIILKGGTA